MIAFGFILYFLLEATLEEDRDIDLEAVLMELSRLEVSKKSRFLIDAGEKPFFWLVPLGRCFKISIAKAWSYI